MLGHERSPTPRSFPCTHANLLIDDEHGSALLILFFAFFGICTCRTGALETPLGQLVLPDDLCATDGIDVRHHELLASHDISNSMERALFDARVIVGVDVRGAGMVHTRSEQEDTHAESIRGEDLEDSAMLPENLLPLLAQILLEFPLRRLGSVLVEFQVGLLLLRAESFECAYDFGSSGLAISGKQGRLRKHTSSARYVGRREDTNALSHRGFDLEEMVGVCRSSKYSSAEGQILERGGFAHLAPAPASYRVTWPRPWRKDRLK